MHSAYRLKNELRNFLRAQSFSHFITVEVHRRYKFSLDDVKSRLDGIAFRLGKAYLKSHFYKWKLDDQFWFAGVQEGDQTLGTDHFHALLHTPELYRSSLDDFYKTFPNQFRQWWWELSPADCRPNAQQQLSNKPIWIEPAQNGQGVATYITKAIPVSLDTDRWFIAHA